MKNNSRLLIKPQVVISLVTGGSQGRPTNQQTSQPTNRMTDRITLAIVFYCWKYVIDFYKLLKRTDKGQPALALVLDGM